LLANAQIVHLLFALPDRMQHGLDSLPGGSVRAMEFVNIFLRTSSFTYLAL